MQSKRNQNYKLKPDTPCMVTCRDTFLRLRVWQSVRLFLLWPESRKGRQKMEEITMENVNGGWWNGCCNCDAHQEEINNEELTKLEQFETAMELLTEYGGNGQWMCQECILTFDELLGVTE